MTSMSDRVSCLFCQCEIFIYSKIYSINMCQNCPYKVSVLIDTRKSNQSIWGFAYLTYEIEYIYPQTILVIDQYSEGIGYHKRLLQTTLSSNSLPLTPYNVQNKLSSFLALI